MFRKNPTYLLDSPVFDCTLQFSRKLYLWMLLMVSWLHLDGCLGTSQGHLLPGPKIHSMDFASFFSSSSSCAASRIAQLYASSPITCGSTATDKNTYIVRTRMNWNIISARWFYLEMRLIHHLSFFFLSLYYLWCYLCTWFIWKININKVKSVHPPLTLPYCNNSNYFTLFSISSKNIFVHNSNRTNNFFFKEKVFKRFNHYFIAFIIHMQFLLSNYYTFLCRLYLNLNMYLTREILYPII